MEFPDLGQHCSENSCKILDFLPLKCDACRNIYCKDHFQYRQHGCSAGVGKDVQVPVCPLCNRPVPSRRGDLPDVAVGDHIDRECQSDPAQAKRKVTNALTSLRQPEQSRSSSCCVAAHM